MRSAGGRPDQQSPASLAARVTPAGTGTLPRTGSDLYDLARVALVLVALGLLASGSSLARTRSADA